MKKNLLIIFTLSITGIFSASKVAAQRGAGAGGYSDGIVPVIEQTLSNYPNPVATSTTIQYDVPEDGKILLSLYNSAGQKMTDFFEGNAVRGSYTMEFNADRLSSGTYVCQYILQTGKKQSIVVRKIQISKN